MHYDIIIVTKKSINHDLFLGLNFLQLDEANLTCQFANNHSYDYLIIDANYPELNLLTEDGKIITNQFFKTSNEQIYALGDINQSSLDLNTQLEIIIEDIKNPS